jgi:hypothetical protein
MSFESLKERIQEIIAIASSVPEEFRQKCFELLMTHALTAAGGPLPSLPHPAGSGVSFPLPMASMSYTGAPPMTSLLAAFVKKIGLTSEQFHRVVGYSHGAVIFYREPESAKSAQTQLEWSLLLALKNAIVNGSFAVDAEEVRLTCQEKGIFDRRSFHSNFRRHADHFRSAPEPAGKPQPLSSKGIAALGALVRTLAERP